MNKLIDLYHENSKGKLTKVKIGEILKRDIFWNVATAKKYGLVDEEWC